MRMGAAAAIAVAPVIAAAQQPALTPARSIQQDFDAAAALSDTPDHAAALAAWEALERRSGRNRRTHAIVLVRKSAVLMAMDRDDDAVAAARAGLADLPANDPTLRTDRYRAWFDLGRIAIGVIDYASAAQAFAEAEANADTPGARLAAQLGVIRAATFVDPAVAQAAAVRADAVVASAQKVVPEVRAALAQRKAQLLLNQGDFAGARRQSAEAVRLLGGLTLKTTTEDVAARSDTAIAALLAGDGDTAREYMAYTGAGRLPDHVFDPAVQMRVPDCGGDAGLKPADLAVVEFSIGDGGTVIAAAPIYAAGGGRVALEFARAALGWVWTPEQVAQLPRFYRYNVRVEMRCSTAFERPSVNDRLFDARDGWLESKGVRVPERSKDEDARSLAAARAALAAAERNANPLAIVPPIDAILASPIVPRAERNALATRALAAMDAAGAPPMARLPLDLDIRATSRADDKRDRAYAADLVSFLSAPAYANDPQARGAIKLLLADADRRTVDRRTAVWLREVADDPALKANDPLKIGALVRIASIAQNAGDPAAARAAFERTGLAANQCAIIDSPPRMLAASGTYPMEAIQWGFEGWTLDQFDVSAEGRVVNQRAILSYPPFVFTKAGVKTIADARFAKTYRPDGGLGCGASTQRVKFRNGR